jgi:hypothetical protein
MPCAAIPTVTPGFSLTAGMHRLAGMAAALCRLGSAWFLPSHGNAPGGLVPTRLQRDELMAMSSHQLSDLGIGRSEIPALFCEPSSWRAGRH